MKNYLLLAFGFTSILGFSQITLSPSDFATGGDTVRMSESSDTGLDFNSTGPSYTWDFSTLTPSSQVLKNFQSMAGAPTFLNFIYGTFAPLKYQASYYIETDDIPVDQIAPLLGVPIEDIFAFTRISVDSVTSIGYSMRVDGQDLPIKSDTIEKRYDFPVQYGVSHFSRGYTKVDFNPTMDAIWIQHRTRNTTVDGFGSITTPYGTFNALRIKHDITEQDSLYYVFPVIGGAWIPLPIPPSHEYEWWTNGEKEPILKITTSDFGGNETITSVEYRDIYRGLDAGMDEKEIHVSVYPNPASDELTIYSENGIESAMIVDFQGKMVFSEKLSMIKEKKINISALAKGCYNLIVVSEEGTSSKLFIKK